MQTEFFPRNLHRRLQPPRTIPKTSQTTVDSSFVDSPPKTRASLLPSIPSSHQSITFCYYSPSSGISERYSGFFEFPFSSAANTVSFSPLNLGQRHRGSDTGSRRDHLDARTHERVYSRSRVKELTTNLYVARRTTSEPLWLLSSSPIDSCRGYTGCFTKLFATKVSLRPARANTFSCKHAIGRDICKRVAFVRE